MAAGRKGWRIREGWKPSDPPHTKWEPDDADRPKPRELPNAAEVLDTDERTPEEMLTEVLRLANRQLAGLTKLGEASMLSDLELQQLGQVQRLVLGHLRVNPGEDPMVQRPDETDAQYLERLETMKARTK